MLTVKLHLCNGDVIPVTMTPAQKNRLSRMLNQPSLPATPFTVKTSGAELEIPWRSIGYISTEPRVSSEPQASQAAD